MKINEVNNQNFTAIVKTDQATRYLNRLPYDESIKAVVMSMDNKNKKVDVFVSTIMKNGKERLKAEVGHKTFVENFFRGAISTLRKATRFANKLEEKQIIENELSEGMVRPRLG